MLLKRKLSRSYMSCMVDNYNYLDNFFNFKSTKYKILNCGKSGEKYEIVVCVMIVIRSFENF